MKLRLLQPDENRLDPLFSSEHCQTVLDMYADYYPQVGFHPPWIAYLVLLNDEVVGLGSFTGQPKDGKVEIAYWTFPAFEGRGVASFACSELTSIARAAASDVTITAKTAPESNASTKILEKHGFVFKEIVQVHEIGDAWMWVLPAMG